MKKLFKFTLSTLFIIPVITSAADFTQYPDMELGYTGSPVIELQKFLNTNNYIVNPIVGEPGSVGYEGTHFGKLTQQALSLFQKDNSILPSEGYFGKKTKKKFDEISVTEAERNNLSAEISSIQNQSSNEEYVEPTNNFIGGKSIKVVEPKSTNTDSKKRSYGLYNSKWIHYVNNKPYTYSDENYSEGTYINYYFNDWDKMQKNGFFLGWSRPDSPNFSGCGYAGQDGTMGSSCSLWLYGSATTVSKYQRCAELAPKHVFFKDINALEKKFAQFEQNKPDSNLKINAKGKVFAYAVEYEDGGVCAKFIDVALKDGRATAPKDAANSFYNMYKGKNIKQKFSYPKTCTVIAYGGVGSTGVFESKVKAIVDTFNKGRSEKEKIKFQQNKFDAAKSVVADANDRIAKITQNEKILFAAHSISSIGLWNGVKNNKISGTFDYLLFDPPYQLDLFYAEDPFGLTGILLGWVPFIGNADSIKDARNSGIADSKSTINWSCGYRFKFYRDCPYRTKDKKGTTPTDADLKIALKKDHERYNENEKALSRINTWIQNNCK